MYRHKESGYLFKLISETPNIVYMQPIGANPVPLQLAGQLIPFANLSSFTKTAQTVTPILDSIGEELE